MGKYDKLSKEELLEMIEKQDTELELKKYGLAWDKEREPEKVVVDCQNNLPILERIANKEIHTNDDADNIMIEGDNYHALKVLNYTHKEKIDVIYIDPPYNTGNKDFIYNDKYVDKEDGYRHSKWLNFMHKRLDLAKNLLKDTGVIFISIDDNEQANLKLLCDKIFGENNFVADFIRKTKSMTGDEGTGVNIQHENLLVYAKDKKNLFLTGEEKDFSNYSNPDQDPNGDWISADPSAKSGGDGTYFEIKNPYTSKVDFPPAGRYWGFSKQTLKEYIKKGKIKFKKEYLDGQRGFIFKRYKNELKSFFNPVNTLFATSNLFMNQVGTKELNELLGSNIFDNPKPVALLKNIIRYASNDNAIVLDFMAGSGTTGHAVLELNKEDGGNRKFILCTNNENKIAEEVCYTRIEKVINGYNFNGKEKKKLFSKKISYKELEKNSEAIFEEVNKIIEKESNNYDKFEKTINEKYLEVYGVKKYSDKKEGLGGNLQYFKTGFVDNTQNEEQIRWNLTNKCIDMLCVRENIFNLKKEGHDYKIFASNRSDKYLCIYYNLADNSFNDFLKEVKGLKGHKSIYMFSLNDKLDKSLFKDIDDCEFEPIPQNILDLYKRIRKKHITEENDKDE